MRTQVGIVGAGPAGLLLSHLLHLQGIESIVVESRSREYVEKRLRAGILEHGTVEVLREAGLADRLNREGLPHEGISLRFDEEDHRIPITELTGRMVTVYGQHEVVKDIIAVRLAADGQLEFEVTDTKLHDLTTDRPRITYTNAEGRAEEIECDVVAGCDGFHGVSRQSIPANHLNIYDHVYESAWLGILAQTPPSHEELIYTHHDRGFALHSMRSPERTRLYVEVDRTEKLENWSDRRIWDELHTRLALKEGFDLNEGPILDRGITQNRSFVAEPMRYGRLFLAGDSAHIVPPTGAKGLNLAVADVRILARALDAFFSLKKSELMDTYSQDCLKRVWRAEHFSWFMTSMLFSFRGADPFQKELQKAQLRYTATSEAAAKSLAENYAGMPFEWSDR
ncbi:4-hydroxybenzoate 3-monooxygenase [Rhodococcus opacus]|uniref:4-hydroxybenzoate 3-monooxygenase n=1 Tax=Rhodococcus opacus TaxID=37919 RepID=A0AAX3YQJ8_RHOOP|nr:4-hydroxybenzoate 3-monooxygenase [Rhodococcus opacus]MCZ4587590.1 4-hydroxybenzoate 3-monooxygenase [Rhodococcus opacus]WLF51410.1 4-hydroxybenzoate 3-monooxygenase [Rhodococcus opacus]